MKQVLIAVALALPAGTAAAVAPGWVCFGVEPSWGLRFGDAGRATLSTPEGAAVDHLGEARRLPATREWLWRGRAPGGGDAVAFIAETACRDGMSDTSHPASVRLSLPDGRFLGGCCRIAAAGGDKQMNTKARSQ